MRREINIKSFKDLKCWKEAHILVLDIYQITEAFPKEERYGIVSQIRRASISISTNISEGFSRYHFKDKTRFYYQARGSLSEVDNFLFLSKDLIFIDKNTYNIFENKIITIGQLINGLIRSVNNR